MVTTRCRDRNSALPHRMHLTALVYFCFGEGRGGMGDSNIFGVFLYVCFVEGGVLDDAKWCEDGISFILLFSSCSHMFPIAPHFMSYHLPKVLPLLTCIGEPKGEYSILT
jgi:hypothetical protein